MAAPHVSGVAALLATARPDDAPAELATLLSQQADPLPCPPDQGSGPDCAGVAENGFYGHGLVDALRAVTAERGAARPGSADVARSYQTER
jgi:subtilisin family serine protease